MKKRLMSTLLMGALFVTSMSVFTSCKDYDDDIANLNVKVSDVTASLTSEKQALADQIASLKNQLEQKDAELALLIQENSQETQAISDRVAAMATLEARIALAEKAMSDLQDILDGKVDASELNAALVEVYGKIEAVEDNLGKAMKEQIDILKDGLQNTEIALQALRADFSAQAEALRLYQARVAELEGKVTNLATTSDLNALVAQLNEKIAVLEQQIATGSYDQNITLAKNEELQAYVAQLDAQITAAQRYLSQLNILADKTLKSLVFVPDMYYWGVEGTYVDVLKYNRFNLTATTYRNIEELLTGKEDDNLGTGYTYASEPDWTDPANKVANADAMDVRILGGGVHLRYGRLTPPTGTRVLDVYANYHMNPSSANLQDAKVELLSDDKDYVRAAKAGLSIIEWETVNGELKVKLQVNEPDLLGTVKSLTSTDETDAVTVFATQVTVKSGETGDTTITSDYATLFAREIKDLVITHIDNNAAATGVQNTHCGYCSRSTTLNPRSHLMATAGEAIQFGAQDQVMWNDTLVLNNLVETHFTDVKGRHAVWTADELKKNGLHYEFELTGYFVGTTETSESAHAAIKVDEETGNYWLRPQNPERLTGNQQEWGAEQSEANLTGRSPLVRVKLIDDATGSIVDYGYIRLVIVKEIKPIITTQWSHVYDPKAFAITNNFECLGNLAAWSYSTTWIQTEYDLYHELDIDRLVFEAVYTWDTVKNYATPEEAADGTYQQYYVSGYTATAENHYQYEFKKVDATHPAYGEFATKNEIDPAEGSRTSTLQWTFSAAQARALVDEVNANDSIRQKEYALKATIADGTQANGNANEIWRAVKYVSNSSNYPDVWVLFKAAPVTVANNAPSAVVNWDPKKIYDYWYATNSNTSGSGKDEVHTNVLTPEDNFDKGILLGDVMDQNFSDLFEGNKLSNPNYLTITDYTSTNDYAANKLTLHLRFDRKNNGKVVKGADGNEYVLRVYENPTSFLDYFNQNDTLLQAVIKSKVDAQTGSTLAEKVAKVAQTEFRDIAVIRTSDKPDNEKLWIDNEYVYYFHNCKADSSLYVGLNAQYHTGSIDYRDHTIAELLLNYKAHNALADDVLSAVIGLNAFNGCPKWLPLTNNTFDVRFLRPLNVVDCVCNSIIDSSTGELQVINLNDLINFSDWRDAWKEGRNTNNADCDYARYYNIKAVEIYGVPAENGDLSAFIRTDLNQTKATDAEIKDPNFDATKYATLKSITQNLDLKYNVNYYTKANGNAADKLNNQNPRWLAEWGTIEYRNISATVGTFHLFIPIRVTYEWGYMVCYVTVTVNKTVANA